MRCNGVIKEQIIKIRSESMAPGKSSRKWNWEDLGPDHRASL